MKITIPKECVQGKKMKNKMMSGQSVDVESNTILLLSFLSKHLLCGLKTKCISLHEMLINQCSEVKNIVKLIPAVMLLLFFLVTQHYTMR
jgi:hypothetical protein